MDEILISERYACLLPTFNRLTSHHFGPLMAELVRLAERDGYTVTFKTPSRNGHWRFILRKLHRPDIKVNCKILSDAFIGVFNQLAVNHKDKHIYLKYDAELQPFTAVHCENLSLAATRRAMNGYRKVSADGVVYPNITACARALGMSAKAIRNRIDTLNPRFANYFFLEDYRDE